MKTGLALPGFVPAPYARALDQYLETRAPKILPPVDPAAERLPMPEWRDRLRAAAAALNDPLLGLHLGKALRPDHFGVMGYLFHSCGTLGGAFARLERYSRLVYDFNPMEACATAEGLRLRWSTELGRPGPLVDECALATLLTLARQLTGTRICPVLIRFVNPAPESLQPYEEFFGCPVEFAATTTDVILRITDLGLPLVAPDPLLLASLEVQADTMLEALPPVGELSRTVRRMISHALPHGMPAQDDIAGKLHRSTRSLHRALADEGTTFRSLLSQTQHDMAEQYLRDPRLGLVDIALLCGYADQSAFTRAYKQWTGVSPAAARKSALRRWA